MNRTDSSRVKDYLSAYGAVPLLQHEHGIGLRHATTAVQHVLCGGAELTKPALRHIVGQYQETVGKIARALHVGQHQWRMDQYVLGLHRFPPYPVRLGPRLVVARSMQRRKRPLP